MRSRPQLPSAAVLVCVLLGGPLGSAAEPTADAQTEARARAEARGEAYAHLMRAMMAARRGEFRNATSEIRRAVKLQPDVPAVYIEGASLLQSMGRYTDAEQLARQALEVGPEDPEVLAFLADLMADRALVARPETKSIEEALALYERLAQVAELDEASLRKLANLQMLAGNLPGAIATTSDLFDRRPGDSDVAQMLYRLLVHDQREEQALEVLLRFILRHPDERPLVEEADRLAAKLEAWEVVVSYLNGDEGLGTGANVAQALRGQALFRLGRLEEAILPLERALSVDSRNRRLRLGLVVAYRSVGRLADAAGMAGGLVAESPDDAILQLILAETLDNQRDEGQALEHFAAALSLMATDAAADGWEDRDRIRLRIVEIRLGQDDPDAAARMLTQLERPDVAEAIVLQARVAIVTEDWNAARQAVRRLRTTDAQGQAALLEGEILLRTSREAKADAKLREAVDLLGDAWRFGVARLYLDHGRGPAGEALLREWVTVQPSSADAWFDLGRYLYALDRFEDTEQALTRAFTLDPRHAPALNFLGYSLAERGERLDEALSLVRRALAVDPWDGAYLDSLGWVYYQMGRYEAARDPLERAVREYPTDPIILEHLGDVYAGLGENELALGAWQRALAAGPDDAVGLEVKIDRAAGLRVDGLPLDEQAAADAPRPQTRTPREP